MINVTTLDLNLAIFIFWKTYKASVFFSSTLKVEQNSNLCSSFKAHKATKYKTQKLFTYYFAEIEFTNRV